MNRSSNHRPNHRHHHKTTNWTWPMTRKRKHPRYVRISSHIHFISFCTFFFQKKTKNIHQFFFAFSDFFLNSGFLCVNVMVQILFFFWNFFSNFSFPSEMVLVINQFIPIAWYVVFALDQSKNEISSLFRRLKVKYQRRWRQIWLN